MPKPLLSKLVFCKPFLHKIAKSFCRLLHLHFVGNCKALAGRTAASHIAIADHILLLQREV